jgi:hypothetical protein
MPMPPLSVAILRIKRDPLFQKVGDKRKDTLVMNCTPKVGQYDILKKLWGCFLWQEDHQTIDTQGISNNKS